MKINNLFNTVFFTFLVLCFTSCKEDSYESIPLIFTGSVQDITSTGAIFNAKITGISVNRFHDCGFVWGLTSDISLSVSDYYSTTEYPGEKPFSIAIKSDLIKDTKYYVRAYCKTTDNKIFYGEVSSFYAMGSEGPVISEIRPSQAFIGDTVLIKGGNFSNLASKITVKFKPEGSATVGNTAKIIRASRDSVSVIVPVTSSISQNVSVSVGNLTRMADGLFTVLTPKVTSFSPTSFKIGDTITIYGENLDKYKGSQFVRFNNTYALLLKGNYKDHIRVKVPSGLNTINGKITFVATLTSIELPVSYTLLNPIPTSFTPASFYPEDTITINGSELDGSDVSVYFQGIQGNVLERSKSYVRVVVPGNLTVSSGSIQVRSIFTNTTFPDPFTLKNPVIYSIEPVLVTSSSVIKVTGVGFSQTSTSNNVLMINNISATAYSSSKHISYYRPVFNNIVFTSRQATAKVKTGALLSDPVSVEINDRWLRMPDYAESFSYAYAYSDNKRALVGLQWNNSLYNFSSSGTYTKLAAFPGEARSLNVGFIIGDNLYYGLGFNPYTMDYLTDFWKYDIKANTWTRLSDFPGSPRQNGDCFVVGSYGFVSSGLYSSNGVITYLNDCWKYSPETDSWTSMAGYRDLEYPGPTYTARSAAVVADDGMVYVCKEKLFRFNPQNGSWTFLSNFPYNVTGASFFGFNHNGKLYFGNSAPCLYSYDPENNDWEKLSTGFISGNNYICLNAIYLDDKIFIGFGRQPSIWEFDPDR